MAQLNLFGTKEINEDTTVKFGFGLSLVMCVGIIGMTLFFYESLPPVLPLFYSLTRGVQQLADKIFISVLPILASVFLIAHYIFVRAGLDADLVYVRIIAMSALLTSLILTIAFLHIIWIVQ